MYMQGQPVPEKKQYMALLGVGIVLLTILVRISWKFWLVAAIAGGAAQNSLAESTNCHAQELSYAQV